MISKRVIARLDIKAPNLIKGIHLEGLRVVGDPTLYAQKYYLQGADELIYMDAVASLYGRNHLADLVRKTAQAVFIPITVGGGIRTLKDVETILRSGADKIAINTAAVLNPHLLTEISKHMGSQCVVLSVEAKRTDQNKWEAYIDNGREHSGLEVIQWCKKAQDLGAGEILLTSVDQEGTRKGFDLALISAVSSAVSIPVVASGGCGTVSHAVDALAQGAQAIALAHLLHFEEASIQSIKKTLITEHIMVREYNA